MPLGREAHVEVKMWNAAGSEHFWTFNCPFTWQALWILHLVKKSAKRVGFPDVGRWKRAC